MSGKKPAGGSAWARSVDKLTAVNPGLLAKIGEVFGLSQGGALGVILLSAVVLIGAVIFCIHSAPSNTITITTGPEGSIAYTNAVKYAKVMAKEGVKLKILTSHGSLENLQRLRDPKSKAEVAFVLDGSSDGPNDDLISLGSISYQPLLIFYRGAPIDSLEQLTGKRIAIGAVGSGTRNLASKLLAANGLKEGDPGTTLLDWDPIQSSQALLDGQVDAVFLMGEDASTELLHQLLRTPNVNLMSFAQADAYARDFTWLSVLKLPEGVLDLGKNIPEHDVSLIGPTVELVARKQLHPALSDLLLATAQEVNGRAGILQKKGEFPAPMDHDFPLSADALRFYKSGKSFFYHYLPFWLASLTSRIVVVVIPTVVVLVPVVRSVPSIYRWRIQSQLYRWYRAMLAVEKELFHDPEAGPEELKGLLERLDEIELAASRMKIPAFFANQFYGLREHIEFVREIIGRKMGR